MRRITTFRSTTVVPYLLTEWCRVFLEKLTGLQLVKEFPAFHGTRMFITALTSVRLLSLSWASPKQSIFPHPISWRPILILSTHLRLGLPSGLLTPSFPTKTLYTSSPHPHSPHASLYYLQFPCCRQLLRPTQCAFQRVTPYGRVCLQWCFFWITVNERARC